MLYRALQKRAEEFPNRTAVAGEERALSFAQLFDQATSAARLLRQRNLAPEDRIVVGMPPSPDFYAIFYAACALGATVVPVLPSGKIPRAVLELRPALAVGDRGFLNAMESACPLRRGTIEWDRKRGFCLPEAGTRPLARKRLIRREKILAVLSSGTTGEPTVQFTTAEVLLRHGQLRAKALGIGADDVLLSTRPFNNMASIDAPVILPLVCGCKVVVREKFQRFEAARTIASEKVTIVYGVPVIFEMLASIPANYPADFSSLRLCVSGGAPLPMSVFNRFYKRFGIAIRQRYGGTQFFPGFNFDRRGVPGAVGQVSGPFPMTVVTERGKRARPGEIGEIALNFMKLKSAFWRSCFKDSPDRRGRYVYTGDLGRVDTSGNLYIVGRKSPFIKVGANRVAPAEVESVMRSHPKVRDVIVTAYRPGKSDEAVRAVVVPDGRVTAQELLAYCLSRLDAYKCPRRIDFRRDLPRNAQGKIIRYDVRASDGKKTKASQPTTSK